MDKNYKLQLNYLGNICSVNIVGTNISIPFDSENIDYQEYLLWLEEGNEPLPPDPQPEPEPLTPQQKLEAAGLTIEELKELLGL
jgi:hypothetical protein